MAIKYRKLTRAERNARIVKGIRDQAGADGPRDRLMQIKKATALIAVAMAELQGGDWRVEIDLDQNFVLIAPRLSEQKY